MLLETWLGTAGKMKWKMKRKECSFNRRLEEMKFNKSIS
jgi:hypothetical protein